LAQPTPSSLSFSESRSRSAGPRSATGAAGGNRRLSTGLGFVARTARPRASKKNRPSHGRDRPGSTLNSFVSYSRPLRKRQARLWRGVGAKPPSAPELSCRRLPVGRCWLHFHTRAWLPYNRRQALHIPLTTGDGGDGGRRRTTNL